MIKEMADQVGHDVWEWSAMMVCSVTRTHLSYIAPCYVRMIDHDGKGSSAMTKTG